MVKNKALTNNLFWVRGVVPFLPLFFFLPFLAPKAAPCIIVLWVQRSAVSSFSELRSRTLAANASSCIRSQRSTFGGCKCSSSVEENLKTEARSGFQWTLRDNVLFIFNFMSRVFQRPKHSLVTALVCNLSSDAPSTYL